MHLAAVLLAALVAAPPPQSDQFAELDRVLREHTRDIGSSAVAVLVLKDGERRYRKVIGQADITRGVRATARTNFRLASITKTMTAASVLWLMDRGKCGPLTTLAEVLPDMPAWAEQVTLAHLLSHTSGVKSYRPRRRVVDRHVLEYLRKQKETRFPPGTRYRYSNEGYALLAMVVEALSGETFPAFLRKNLFEPLKMTATKAFVAPGDDIERRALGTRKGKDGRWRVYDQGPTTAILGDGGVYSNLEDMERWLRAIRERRLLSPESWRRALTIYPVERRKRDDHYGMGFNLNRWLGHAGHSHRGTTRGFRNHYVSLPERGIDLLILTNVDLFDTDSLARDLLQVMLGGE